MKIPVDSLQPACMEPLLGSLRNKLSRSSMTCIIHQQSDVYWSSVSRHLKGCEITRWSDEGRIDGVPSHRTVDPKVDPCFIT
jgi:hypothetical protein